MLTWSLGCTGDFVPRGDPNISLARLLMTSLTFMLLCVPKGFVRRIQLIGLLSSPLNLANLMTANFVVLKIAHTFLAPVENQTMIMTIY